MNIDIQIYRGTDLATYVSILGDYRLRYFKDFPYLYVGTEEEERKHMMGYIAEPTARLVIAWDRDASNKIIGVAISTMLSSETKILKQAGDYLQKYGIIPAHCSYFGEMIFDPAYRNKGIGKRMIAILKEAGIEQGAERFSFLAVHREPNDARRPGDHVNSDLIFRKLGFEKTDLFVTFEWKTILINGSIAPTPNRLDFWIDRQFTSF